jgi:hypothetical protein
MALSFLLYMTYSIIVWRRLREDHTCSHAEHRNWALSAKRQGK